jgi:hypothetical protein
MFCIICDITIVLWVFVMFQNPQKTAITSASSRPVWYRPHTYTIRRTHDDKSHAGVAGSMGLLGHGGVNGRPRYEPIEEL